jgi:HEAT repeat protein
MTMHVTFFSALLAFGVSAGSGQLVNTASPPLPPAPEAELAFAHALQPTPNRYSEAIDAGQSSQQDPAHPLYREGYKLVLEEKWDEARKKLAEVVSRYPKSRYVDDAEYWTAYSFIRSNPTRAAELYKRFVARYPRSNYFDDAVADLGRLEGQAVADSVVASIRRAPPAPPALAVDVVPRLQVAPTVTIPPIGPTPATPRSEKLDEGVRLKMDALHALRRSPEDESAFEVLKEVALDSSQVRELRETALFALDAFKRFDVLPVYLAVLAGSKADHRIKETVLFSLGKRADADDEKAYSVVRNHILDKNQPTAVREAALYSLRNLKRPDLLRVYLDILKNDPDPKLKQNALYYVGQLAKGDDTTAVGVLKTTALDRSQPRELRETAVYSLHQLKRDDVLDILFEIAKSDPDRRMKQSALYFVGQRAQADGGRAYELLRSSALDRDQHREVRESAIYSLARLGRGDILTVLADLAKNDPDEHIRSSAVHHLRQLRKDRGAEVSKVFRDLVADTKQPRQVRTSAMYALRDFTDFDVVAYFMELARTDPDHEIQATAIYYIGQSSKDKSKSLDALIKLFDTIPQDRTQTLESLLYSIASVGNDRAVDVLANVARTHPNYELRRRAVYYLGNVGGERARAALLEILRSK